MHNLDILAIVGSIILGFFRESLFNLYLDFKIYKNRYLNLYDYPAEGQSCYILESEMGFIKIKVLEYRFSLFSYNRKVLIEYYLDNTPIIVAYNYSQWNTMTKGIITKLTGTRQWL